MYKRLAVAVIAGLFFVGLQTGRASGPAQHAQLLSVTRWQIPEGWFGGYSGLILSEDGKEMIALSDRGHFVKATLTRSKMTSMRVENVHAYKVLNSGGEFERNTGLRDSEGLARQTDGQLVVSFEGSHRIERFRQPGESAQRMPWSRALNAMVLNGGFEGIAEDAEGRLYAFPELPIGADDRMHGFRLEGNVWRQRFILKRDKQFQPVGMDFGPDGRLYLLERGFNGLGFRTRVRSFAMSGDRLHDEKLLFHKGVGVHDNLEGLSVWRDELGRIRLTMISDDNFRLLQRTEIVEYVVIKTP
ncbi:esterase-like activity of phytase family protein [Shimia sp. W99]